MKNNLEIGNRIRKLREDLKMSRNTFSEHINISEIYLAKLERGEKSPTIKVILSVCDFTDCSADYILYGKEDEGDNLKKKIIRLINRSSDKNLELYYDLLRCAKSHSDDK